MKKLRLVLFEDCDRSCEGCCNKDWDVVNLPTVDNYKGYDIILLTGGEPLLKPVMLKQTIEQIKKETDAKIILYTAMTTKPNVLKSFLRSIDGITITLHEQSDVSPFIDFAYSLTYGEVIGKSLRLNVFELINWNAIPTCWEIKDDIQWINNCPLPEGEVLMRLPKETP